MKVYIAGKVTGDPDYKCKFATAKQAIEHDGHTVLAPAVLPGGMSNADYMRICLAMIDTADLVVFLPDWLESEGAKLERMYCIYTKKPFRTTEWAELAERWRA